MAGAWLELEFPLKPYSKQATAPLAIQKATWLAPLQAASNSAFALKRQLIHLTASNPQIADRRLVLVPLSPDMGPFPPTPFDADGARPSRPPYVANMGTASPMLSALFAYHGAGNKHSGIYNSAFHLISHILPRQGAYGRPRRASSTHTSRQLLYDQRPKHACVSG